MVIVEGRVRKEYHRGDWEGKCRMGGFIEEWRGGIHRERRGRESLRDGRGSHREWRGGSHRRGEGKGVIESGGDDGLS